MVYVVFVEGNIASGKSTLIPLLASLNGSDRFGKVQVILEPLDKWQTLRDSDGKNILHHFYKDMKRFAYSFQSFAFLSRARLLSGIDSEADFVFVERSIWSDKEIFARNCYETGIMSEIEWNLYNEWFSWMEQQYRPLNMCFIHLKTKPSTAFIRMKKRKRAEEASVTLEYITRIHQKHQAWLDNSTLGAKVIELNANMDYDDSGEILEGIISRLSKELPDRLRVTNSTDIGYGCGC